ncbi:MAG: CoA transferase [Parvibaculum sp.]|uniref:CaiB/BaiF CoA transferase family protein n=1 Tax=Parvibaculum sp. TaxID=2024848 RepID=UPI00260069D0|nr:CoA transferase [Parvibaculum sp.]MCE9648300.1 CoA transferase [Parvibaculum sp.]
MEKQLLEDLLVIDCASFIAGPAAATIMSDFGARVIKIEPPVIGDSYRQLMNVPGMPPAAHDYFWTLDNRNKESLALDLKRPEARAVLDALIEKADVFITNFPGPIRERLRLRAEDVMPLNERIVYASLTPYGEEGPEKDRTGYDATAWWARSGLMDAVRATPDTPPGFSVPGMGDHPTATALFGAIMTALYKRERTGKGSAVSTSLLANGLWSNGIWMQAALCEADFSVRLERGMRGALTELYKCRCGRWFMLAMLNYQREWPLLTDIIGKPEWRDDPRFATHEARRANAPALVAALEEVIGARDWSEWKPLFQKAGITFGPIAQPADHLECPQVAANDFLPEIDGAAGLRTVDSPIRMTGQQKRKPGKAPAIGEHTRAVLAGIGMNEAAIDAMIASGAAAE